MHQETANQQMLLGRIMMGWQKNNRRVSYKHLFLLTVGIAGIVSLSFLARQSSITSSSQIRNPTTSILQSYNESPATDFGGSSGVRFSGSKIRSYRSSDTKKEILVIVMSEKNSYTGWVNFLGPIDASLEFLYGSYDLAIPETEWENDHNLVAQSAFIPQTTWTEARNRLAAEALRMEIRRGKEYDWWLFLDDDLELVCIGDEVEDEKMQAIVGKGSCWQKAFNFMSSDLVPEHVSTLYPGGDPTGQYSAVSTTDAMFAAFKRSHVPYLLPYARLPEGASEWSSQACVFCLMQTCMRSSTLLIPYVAGKNAAHREYTRGLNKPEILRAIADNYHNKEAGFFPCGGGLNVTQGFGRIGPFETSEELNNNIPPTEFEMCSPMKARFEEWEAAVIDNLEEHEGLYPLPAPAGEVAARTTADSQETAVAQIKDTDILVIVMGENVSFSKWLDTLASIEGSISFLFGSFDEMISTEACNHESNIDCQVAFIPTSTWTQGRNLLAGEALRKEVRRGKKYDYWLFLDDDVDGDCSDGGYPMERLLGEGSCWQKIFNYIASDQVPEKASVVTLPNGAGTAGFAGFSSTDAMFAAFKRDRVPYLLPYVNLQEGSSEWTSQASLFCAMETCMKSSAVLVPFVGGINPALTREFIRGYNLGQIRETIAVNYHDEQAGFFPCQGINPRQVMQGFDPTGVFGTVEELNDHIPTPEFELCQPMKSRFEKWESEQLASEPLQGYVPTDQEVTVLPEPSSEVSISFDKNVDILVMVMGEGKFLPRWKGTIGHLEANVSLLYGSFDEALGIEQCENVFDMDCEVAFIPDTTWTQGRNLLAAQAVRKERRRGKEYDYWVFLDDDVNVHCGGGEDMEQLLGVGDCWQKVFNFISSNQVPEKVSVVSLPLGGNGMLGFAGYSNTDAMFAAFKRERLPYLLPYATIREGGSEWTSQAALYCAIQTCMKSSTLLVPYVGGRNKAHREYIRGLNMGEIYQTIVDNYHDDAADFHPCANLEQAMVIQGRDYSGTFDTMAELNEVIPDPELELCEPMRRRFEEWAGQIVA